MVIAPPTWRFVIMNENAWHHHQTNNMNITMHMIGFVDDSTFLVNNFLHKPMDPIVDLVEWIQADAQL